jgi:LmbE family N-acetylglucosaminyl deacetylase
MSSTIVSFHAHPDDEALLTAGTLARAAADGHRVVLVVATGGEAGLAAGAPSARALGRTRLRELEASAAAIGAARVVVLGHRDSGSDGRVAPGCFAALDPVAAGRRLADLLVEEGADVLTTYDAAGGYGHPDHRQVHRVGRAAARLVGTPVVLEATVDRTAILRATRPLRWAARVAPVPFLPDLRSAYTAREELTHCVDVRPHLDAKLASLRAHASQASADSGARTLALLLGLPRPLQRRVLGREWFREVGRAPSYPLLDDVFATLRRQPVVPGRGALRS